MANLKTSSTHNPARRQREADASRPIETADLETLRQLILGDSIGEILNSSLQAEAVSRVLPKALARAGYQKNEMTRALMPTVEEAIKESVRLDEKILAEVMFPIIGPATRKSIAAAIDGLLQSLNQTLEYSVSAKSVGWRWEAFKTGKTFAEVVMLRTLVFQVEQVLLIHKETGLLLLHRVVERAESQDPDLVSAMLTAIQDFVQDSFSIKSGESLETLKLGDLNVWIEESPHAVLACVVRGNAPTGLRALLRVSQEKIQRLFGEALENFEGDAEKLEGSAPYLDDCLHFRFEGQPTDEEKRVPFSKGQKAFGWAIALIITIAIGIHTFLGYQVQQNWNSYIADLEQQPGLVVISQRQQGGQYMLSGLRDPLAVDPMERLATAHLKPEQVKMNWQPYWSLAPELAGKRMQALLKPSPAVETRLDDQGRLHLSGRASEDWIINARRLSQQMFGEQVWQDDGLISEQRAALEVLRSRIESRRLLFQPTRAVPIKRDRDLLAKQIEDIAILNKQADAINQTIEITVIAYSDRRGSRFLTVGLGKNRANYAKEALVRQGISATIITAKGLAASPANGSADFSRQAVFKVDFTR